MSEKAVELVRFLEALARLNASGFYANETIRKTIKEIEEELGLNK